MFGELPEPADCRATALNTRHPAVFNALKAWGMSYDQNQARRVVEKALTDAHRGLNDSVHATLDAAARKAAEDIYQAALGAEGPM